MKSPLIYDSHSHRFEEMPSGGVKRFLRAALIFILSTFSCSVLAFFVLSVFVTTDRDRKLMAENRMYSRLVGPIEEGTARSLDAITYLQHRDINIYRLVFHSEAPVVDPMLYYNSVVASDTVPERNLVGYVAAHAASLSERSARVDSLFLEISGTLAASGCEVAPMRLPCRLVSPAQTGASTGRRFNPFLKAMVPHSGLDIIAQRGDSVFVTADGKVISVTVDKVGGKTVKVSHSGGYVTKYSHLESVLTDNSRTLHAGDVIGTVGMTGQSSAPHLHYELWRDGTMLDPVNYFFASASPSQYAGMLYMASKTVQSMD